MRLIDEGVAWLKTLTLKDFVCLSLLGLALGVVIWLFGDNPSLPPWLGLIVFLVALMSLALSAWWCWVRHSIK